MDIFYQANSKFSELIRTKQNFVFIGEAGSGKSEIVLNTAVMLSSLYSDVDIFDLDQTKPLYRSRDMAADFANRGITIHYQDQYLDAPTAVGGVATSLLGDGATLLDIGGGHQASRMAGAYSHILKNPDSVAVYIMNPYRPWSRSIDGIDGTMSHILRSINLDRIYILANPNLGISTTVSEFMEGLNRLDEMLRGITTYSSACIRRDIYEDARHMTDLELIPIDLYLTYSWVD